MTEESRERRPVRSRPRRGLALAGRAVLLLATTGLTFALAFWGTLWATVRSPDVAIPSVIDLDEQVAEAKLRSLGLAPRVASRRYDATRPEGKVLEQFPPPGNRTKPGREVRLVVSLGPERAIVPDLRRGSLRRAQIALAAAGLRVATTASVPHGTIPLGRVIAQDPSPGTVCYPGDGVSLLLSAGPPRVARMMPLLEGDTWARARRLLEGAGFRRVRYRGIEDRAPGDAVVIAQDPRPGSRVDPDDRVILFLEPPPPAGTGDRR